MEKVQRDYLSSRLSNAVSKANSFVWSGRNPANRETVQVRAAHRLLKKADNDKRKRQCREQVVIRKASDKVKEAILFGDEKKAIQLLHDFEKQYLDDCECER